MSEIMADQSQMEEALRASERKYRHLYHHTPVMMHSIDPVGRLVSVSELWLKTLGYTWDEVIGRKSIEFLTAASRRYAEEVVLPEYFRTGVCKDVPYQFVRKDGTVIDTLLSAIADCDAEGQIMRSLAVIIDVTDLKRAETERREAFVREQAAHAEAESAREIDRLRRQFVDAVTHELRTPLTTILGYAEFLEEEAAGTLTPAQVKFLFQIRKASRQLAALVDDLLDVASMEAGTFALRRRHADLAAQIAEIAESMRPQVSEAGLTLAVDLPAPPLSIDMDPERIGQVLLNFVVNAVKFTPRGGALRVSAAAADGFVRCEVQDSGVGVSPDDIPKLFQRFSQLEYGRHRTAGTGLGLFICKAIVEAHGGAIGVQSEPGRGATFWFTLPQHLSPEREGPT